jgi:hypothetical protein
MSGKYRLFSAAVTVWMFLVPPAFVEPAPLTLPEIETLIESVAGDVAAGHHDKAAQRMSGLGEPFNDKAAALTSALNTLSGYGNPLYYDKVIDRSYGKTGKDVIYKVAYDRTMVFLRFVLHKRKGENWMAINFSIQQEGQEPLPKAWTHIIP